MKGRSLHAPEAASRLLGIELATKMFEGCLKRYTLRSGRGVVRRRRQAWYHRTESFTKWFRGAWPLHLLRCTREAGRRKLQLHSRRLGPPASDFLFPWGWGLLYTYHFRGHRRRREARRASTANVPPRWTACHHGEYGLSRMSYVSSFAWCSARSVSNRP